VLLTQSFNVSHEYKTIIAERLQRSAWVILRCVWYTGWPIASDISTGW
jgi:hypothetical protein